MSSCCQCRPGPPVPDARREWMRIGLAALVAAQSMVFSLALNLTPPSGTIRTALHVALAVSAVIVFALLGGPLMRAAWQPRIVTEQWFLAGILGAFGASVVSSLTGVGHVYYEVVAILLAIYTFGRVIGDRQRRQALAAADGLAAEFGQPTRPGEIVSVPAGAPVTVDGTLLDGPALVRETALTGEPFPVIKRTGDSLWAGSYVLDAAISIRSFGGVRQLDALLEKVRAARREPARLQREADRLTAWFLPAVMAIAACVFAVGALKGEWTAALFQALAVILVACPCSLGLATPIGIWSALADLARQGLIAHSGDLVEKLSRVNVVIFDKTGTLGEERMQLVDFVATEDREALLRAVASLQLASEHPIAAAFPKPEFPAVVTDPELIPGIGLRGRVDGRWIEVGNGQLARGEEIDSLRRQLRDESHLVVVRVEGRLAGLASLREPLRETSRQSLRRLEEMGIAWHVFTGDQTAAGLANAETGMSPHQKLDRLRELQKNGAKVLFVGDGINDAPAMSGANAALAIASGSTLARETADGEILGGNLLAVPAALERCREATRAIRGNLYFAAAYNVIGIKLAAMGILHPVAAALLMLASSFTVGWRALRPAAKPSVEPVSIQPPLRPVQA